MVKVHTDLDLACLGPFEYFLSPNFSNILDPIVHGEFPDEKAKVAIIHKLRTLKVHCGVLLLNIC